MSKQAPNKRMMDVLRAPVISEKSSRVAELNNNAVFEVAIDATKPAIREAVEALFDVKVRSVNTLIQKGKVKTFRGRPGRRRDMKKAVVRLEDGHMIDVMTGL